VQRRLIFTGLLLCIIYHYMFRPNWPSTGVHVVIQESAAHSNPVLLVLLPRTNCRLYPAVAMHVFGLSVICVVLY
jgi:hypothetical protein